MNFLSNIFVKPPRYSEGKEATEYICSRAYEDLLDPNTSRDKAIRYYSVLIGRCAHIYTYQEVENAVKLRNEIIKKIL